jgi:hypothetical protein
MIVLISYDILSLLIKNSNFFYAVFINLERNGLSKYNLDKIYPFLIEYFYFDKYLHSICNHSLNIEYLNYLQGYLWSHAFFLAPDNYLFAC